MMVWAGFWIGFGIGFAGWSIGYGLISIALSMKVLTEIRIKLATFKGGEDAGA